MAMQLNPNELARVNEFIRKVVELANESEYIIPTSAVRDGADLSAIVHKLDNGMIHPIMFFMTDALGELLQEAGVLTVMESESAQLSTLN